MHGAVPCCVWQGSACRKQLLADIPLSWANHSHFELHSLIWWFQSLPNYVGANYWPYIKPAFLMSIFPI